jgi:hypothetical protein
MSDSVDKVLGSKDKTREPYWQLGLVREFLKSIPGIFV